MISSFSVIVPVLNKENEIIRTLESIAASIDYFYEQYDSAQAVAAEIIVVDEGSSDRTPELLAQFGQQKPYFKVINHFKSLGIGPARNTGVKISQGDILFFCDGDDLFFKEHIYLCFMLLNHQPNAADNTPTSFPVTVGNVLYPLSLPSSAVGVVRTGVRMQDELHPDWKAAIENTIALNLCIRRDCHEFVEGFPEAPIYKQVGCEDISYDLWVAKFFKVLKVNIETVEYIRYPGNNLDRQLKKFQTPPNQYRDETPPEEIALHLIRRKLEQDRFNYLAEKFKETNLTPEFFTTLNWQNLASEYLAQNCYNEAIALYEQGIALEPRTRDSVKNILAAAYNNLGSALHQQGQLESASTYFKQAIDINPALSPVDLARVHFNIGTVLNKQGQFEQSISYLQKAIALHPNFPEAIAELAQATDQSQLRAKGYQFIQGLAELNFELLASHLNQLTHHAALSVLEIGSRDGRMACWLLDNILTRESDSITCVERFEELLNGQSMAERFEANIARTGAAEKVQKIAGKPNEILRSQADPNYHLIYVNGLTTASDMLEVAVLSWRLLRIGGILVFADYGSNVAHSITQAPKAAIDAFINSFDTKIKRLHQGTEVVLEKIAD